MSDSPPRKRPRSETLTPDYDENSTRLGLHTLESIKQLLVSLREVSVDKKSYVDPSSCVTLPFPSLLRSSIPRSYSATGQDSFSHMGRSALSPVMSAVGSLDRRTLRPVVLFGTYGSGKSHLLTALASILFAQGKRVVFMPECCLVAEDPVFWLKLAFTLAFADLPQTSQRITQFKTVDDFVEFARDCREDIYFLVDGPDRLEPGFGQTIRALASSHFYIYTTCAPDADALTVHRATSIRIPSGLTPDELVHWTRHFETQLPSFCGQNMLFLDDYTCRIPALLRSLFDFGGENFDDVVSQFRTGYAFQSLADNVDEFHHTQIEKLSDAQRSRYMQLMTACLTETIPEVRPGSNTALYDPRYFFFDSDGRGHCICGAVSDNIVPLLRQQDLHLFISDAWYTGARSANPMTRDLAITQICLTRIGIGGLTHADSQGNAMRICAFRHSPNFSWMFEEAWKAPRGMTSFLCIPGPEVCKFFNAVILRINPSDKTAHLIPLQITTTQTCSSFATLFFAVTWHKWESAIQEEGFQVINTFVCVDSGTVESAAVNTTATAFRNGVKFVSPEYTVRDLRVGLLDSKLGRILEGDKYHSPSAPVTKIP
ncbi:hypothetical protein B0H10DRAFT_725210 [Mycena sp. CBHHK59/15]|nr:hypothetical protein B0H10DRAFT_725210 [Mycena sp. CBHHK59/15]